MNAQEIKNILIAYLKAANCEIRIYQEKSIGEAVCDLMTVTSCLTGYEIKSDLDNYRRLNRQIKAYDLFFEKCYIVVGGRHIESAGRKVPDHWGIITIQSDQVIVNRAARAGKPSCASQLSVLWRLELTNLLTKTGLPLYTYKSKRYIIDRIVEKLDQAEIKRHVAYELMHRDYTLFNAKDYSLHFDGGQAEEEAAEAVSGLPAEEIVDVLSEQNLEEMTLDRWIALYAQAKELQKSKENLSRVRTAPRPPHDIPYTDIEVSLGVPWVSERIIEELTYAQIKALAISQPLMKVLAEQENELRRLRILSDNHIHTQEALRQDIAAREKQLTILNEKLAVTERNVSYVGGISVDSFQAAYKNVKAILTEDVILGRTASPPELSVLGFGIAIPGVEQQNAKKPYLVLSRNGADYPIEMGSSSAGNARRVVNFLKRFHELPKRIGEQRDECL